MKNDFLKSLDKIHTTELGDNRIKKNLHLKEEDSVSYCKSIIQNKNCNIYRKGKNWYCELNNIKITINSNSYSIITAHIINKWWK